MNSIRKQYNKRISLHRAANIRTYLFFSPGCEVRRDEAVSGNCIFACTMAQKADAVTHAQVSRSLCLDLTSRTVYLCTDFYHQKYVADACGALYLEFCLPHGHTHTRDICSVPPVWQRRSSHTLERRVQLHTPLKPQRSVCGTISNFDSRN